MRRWPPLSIRQAVHSTSFPSSPPSLLQSPYICTPCRNRLLTSSHSRGRRQLSTSYRLGHELQHSAGPADPKPTGHADGNNLVPGRGSPLVDESVRSTLGHVVRKAKNQKPKDGSDRSNAAGQQPAESSASGPEVAPDKLSSTALKAQKTLKKLQRQRAQKKKKKEARQKNQKRDTPSEQTQADSPDAVPQTQSDESIFKIPTAAPKGRRRAKIRRVISKDPHPASDENMSLQQAMMGKVLEPAETDEAAKQIRENLAHDAKTLAADDLQLTPLAVEQPPVPSLHYGLDRVLFNQGVYQLQDPNSSVYNFDPYLQKIMPVKEFDYNSLKEYKTSSQDTTLSDLAKEYDKKYVGSTSSMTAMLTHFHYLLSSWRPLNMAMLSRDFPEISTTFTEINRAPSSIFLRWKNGTYAIDADKEYDGANVLMLLGKSMEKLLTMPTSEFERYRKSDPRDVSEQERNAPESFHYSTQGDFLMRSQLDAYDPRLPGTGMFDLKTRAVVSVRMESENYEEMSGYELFRHHGRFESYEREYYDMVRSTMLKYSLQVRMGRMDGIFVAYHNVKRIFGFQYLSLSEMDRALHGQTDRCLGHQEFALSLELLNEALNKATERFPEQSLRFHFETRPSASLPFMYIFAEPVNDEEIDRIQNSQKAKIAEFERIAMGMESRVSQDESHGLDQNEGAPADSQAITPVDGQSPIQSAEETEESNASPNTTGFPSIVDFLAPVSFEAEKTQETSNQPAGPLLAMTLNVRSRVNGDYVDRPEDLKPTDKWEIEYSLLEQDTPSRAWALYAATKARRAAIHKKASGDGADAQGDSTEGSRKKTKFFNGYLSSLRELARKGREERYRLDSEEVDKEKVVFGLPYIGPGDAEPIQHTHSAEAGVEKAAMNVEHYMQWLYAQR